MSGISMKATGFAEIGKQFDRAAAALDEKAMREDLHAAVQPLLERIKGDIPRDTGLTAEDVEIADAQSDGVKIEIGASRGKQGRAYILNFIEYGTRRQAARPVVRPAWDALGSSVMIGFTNRLRTRVLRALRGGA